jgi:hypothetical protein
MKNLDDIANAPTDYQIEMKVDSKFTVTTDLNQLAKKQERHSFFLKFSGEKRTDFSIFIEPKQFLFFRTNNTEVILNLKNEFKCYTAGKNNRLYLFL